jgi:hypothetical protein
MSLADGVTIMAVVMILRCRVQSLACSCRCCWPSTYSVGDGETACTPASERRSRAHAYVTARRMNQYLKLYITSSLLRRAYRMSRTEKGRRAASRSSPHDASWESPTTALITVASLSRTRMTASARGIRLILAYLDHPDGNRPSIASGDAAWKAPSRVLARSPLDGLGWAGRSCGPKMSVRPRFQHEAQRSRRPRTGR